MNEHQDAARRIIHHIKPLILNSDPKVELIGIMDLEIIQELADRATPARPYTDYFYYFCESCDKQLGAYGVKHNVNYCPNCGQKVGWSEINE